MYKSALIKQLKTYSHKEIKELGEYVKSPFFNKNQSVIRLFDYICKQYPAFDENKFEKETVYREIFPDAEYNDGFMRTIIFKLSNLADDYLSHKRFKQNYFIEKWFLLHELNDRMLDRQIEKKIKETLINFSNVNVHEADYFLFRFLIEYEHFYYMNRVNQDKIEKFIDTQEIENMFNHLTYFYLLRAFKHFDYYSNAKEIYNLSFKTEIFEDIIKSLKQESYEEVPVIELYYNISMLHLRKEDTSYFYKVKKQIEEIEDKINKYETANTYVNLENYCKKRARSGDKIFLNELFDILKIEIEKGLYSVHGYMSAKFYRCVVDTALKLKEFKWTRVFMETYKDKLPPKDIENTYNFSLALFEFSSNNFNKSLEYLSTVKYDEVYQKTEVRCLMAQLYLELGLEESLFSHIDSFRHFLLNDRHLPHDRKLFFLNFIKFIKRISNIKDCLGKQNKESLKKVIQEEKIVYNKDWLLKKISEIKLV
jgi:hypothetical protein